MYVSYILLFIIIILVIIIAFVIIYDIRKAFLLRYNNIRCKESFDTITAKTIEEDNHIANRYNICYPSCKKLKNMLITSIKSFLKNNDVINIFIFNNKEYDEEDIKDIHKAFKNYPKSQLFIVDISPWMKIFKECRPLKGQINCHIRLLMPMVFKKMFPKVKKILYCDEDCYCVGPITKLMNFKMGTNHYGERYLLAGFLDRVCYSYDAIDNYHDALFVYDNNSYICSGMMLMSTDFTIRNKKVIKAINLDIILNYINKNLPLLHDQFIINIFDLHTVIPVHLPLEQLADRHWRDTWKILVKQTLLEYNVAHDFEYKNNEKEMLKDGVIKRKDLTQ